MPENDANPSSRGDPPVKAEAYGPAPAPDRTFEEKMADMAKVPLFMNALDAEEAGEDNVALEAIKALAYEGEPDEVAQNFRNYGNESFREKNWRDAVEYYTKAL